MIKTVWSKEPVLLNIEPQHGRLLMVNFWLAARIEIYLMVRERSCGRSDGSAVCEWIGGDFKIGNIFEININYGTKQDSG